MNSANIGMMLVTVVPAIFLCFYIFKMDRKEKEPVSLLLILLGTGILVYVPVIFAEDGINRLLNTVLSSVVHYNLSGVVEYTSAGAEVLHKLLSAFFGNAIIEESAKWIILFLITHKNKNFNCLFDGVVYSAYVAIGFVITENIYFASVSGWDTLFLRLVSSIPGHIAFSIIMGYAYSVWHTKFIAKKTEENLKNINIIKSAKTVFSANWLCASIIMPVAVHGIYNFVGAFVNAFASAVFFILIGILYVFCFQQIRRLSATDKETNSIIKSVLLKKYPHLAENSQLIDENLYQ